MVAARGHADFLRTDNVGQITRPRPEVEAFTAFGRAVDTLRRDARRYKSRIVLS